MPISPNNPAALTKRWTLTGAKANFAAVVNAAQEGEPQLITRRGQDAVVVLSVKDYERLSGERSVLDVLRGIGNLGDLDLERIRDVPREIDL